MTEDQVEQLFRLMDEWIMNREAAEKLGLEHPYYERREQILREAKFYLAGETSRGKE